MFTVIITEKGGQKRKATVSGTQATVGRMQGTEIMLPLGNVSKKHCRIEQVEEGFLVEDIGSTNGTYINGRKLTKPTVIGTDDKLYVGEFILRVMETTDADEKDEPSRVSRPPIPPPAPRSKKNPMPPGPSVKQPATVTATVQTPSPMVTSASDDDDQVEQLVDFVALEMTEIDRSALPAKVDYTVAQRIQTVLSAMVSELSLRDGQMDSKTADDLLRRAYLAIVDMGDLSTPLRETPPHHLTIGIKGKLTDQETDSQLVAVQSDRDIARLAALLAALAGADAPTSPGRFGFVLPGDQMVTGWLAPQGAALISISPLERLNQTGTKLNISDEFGRLLDHTIENNGKILVIGQDEAARWDVLCSLLERMPVAGRGAVEPFNLLERTGKTDISIPFEQPNRVGSAWHMASTTVPGWLILRSGDTGDLPTIFQGLAMRGQAVVELPWAGDNPISEAMLNLAGNGTALPRTLAGELLACAFDTIVCSGRNGERETTISSVWTCDDPEQSGRWRQLFDNR